MIEPIVIKVVDKVPIVVSGPQYVVCNNSDYTVVWQLDEEWAQFEHRTMQVNYKDGTFERVLFTGDSCTLPAISVPGPVHVGLFAGDIHTTRPARLLAVRSATTDCGEERDPMPNGYAQAIEALDGKLDKNQGADNAGKALVIGDDGNVVPGEALPEMSAATKGQYLTNDGETAEWADVDALPAMSADTAGKALFNDGENAEWGGAVRYDVEQSLTDTQKAQARENIESFPRKILPYFFDTSESSDHDNDIMSAQFGDVISPGNTYTDANGYSNEGMTFPAFVLSRRQLYRDTYQVEILDASGQPWYVIENIFIGTGGKTYYQFYGIQKAITEKVMRVNFTQDDDGNLSADKNWDDAAALIEAGGLVFTRFPYYFLVEIYIPNEVIVFRRVGDTTTTTIGWESTGKVMALGANLPNVLYIAQTLTTDQQAIARKNIGLDQVDNTSDANKPVSTAQEAAIKVVQDAVNKKADATAIPAHNTAADAHSDIRLLVEGLTTRLNALANSDDTTLDQMAEVVAYIKANRELIESVTTAKVNVSDIIDNLTTNASNKPLSAAQGVALKALIDAITVPTKVSELTNDSGYLTSYTESDPTVPAWAKAATKPTYTASEVGAIAQSDLQSATDAALAQAKASGDFKGDKGADGTNFAWNLASGTANGEGWSKTSFDAAERTFSRSTTATSESYIQRTVSLTAGKTYTFSAYLWSNGKVTSADIFAYDKTVKNVYQKSAITLTTSPVLYSLTFTPKTDNAFDWTSATIRFDNNGSTANGTQAILYAKDVKLEEGSVATPWCTTQAETIGKDGSDASVTKANVVAALGYTPAQSGNCVTYTSHANVTAGKKEGVTTYTYGQSPMVVSNGVIIGGSAQNAGLVTRGICGVTTPDDTGACSLEYLYINYDGDNKYTRAMVLGAGSAGNDITTSTATSTEATKVYGTTQAAVRGDQMVNYVTAKISGKQDKSTLETDVAAKGFTKNTGTYSKPSGGIPKSDLASAVQTSLGRADTLTDAYINNLINTALGVIENGAY